MLPYISIVDMQGINPDKTAKSEDVCAFDSPSVLNSTGVGKDDQELFGYVQDSFEFLDQMDCSVMDHMDSSSYQVGVCVYFYADDADLYLDAIVLFIYFLPLFSFSGAGVLCRTSRSLR